MATSKQKIRVYVSKVQSDTCEYIIVKSNFSKKYDYNRSDCSTLIITGLPDDEIIKRIKNFMISFFGELTTHIAGELTKFDVNYFFNKEYSANGQLLYHYPNKENGRDKSKWYFHRMYWVDLIKPLTDKEIELFIRALREIPFLGE